MQSSKEPHLAREPYVPDPWAMVSKARLLDISVKAILKHAGWKTERSFALHYNKKIEKKKKIAKTLLQV